MDLQTARLPGPETLDPRIRRSRRMLHDALATLLLTKDFDKISIQDIAETSTLNRATFYDHYPDKFALLQCMVGSRFSELMARRDVRVGDCESALQAIALGVCDYLAEAPACPTTSQQAPMQGAIVGVIHEMLLQGLHAKALVSGLNEDMVASTVAWAIYGAANAWLQKPKRCSAEHMADLINQLVKPMIVAALADDKAAIASPKRDRELRRR